MRSFNMLKQLRKKKTAKRIFIMLALVIIPAFVFWGFGSALRSKREANFVGKIAGKKISLLDFQDALDAVKNQMIMQLGDKFFELRKFLNLEERAWERLILLQEAKNRKIKASDREVIELIESYPFFSRNEKFDNRIYNQSLQYVFRTLARVFEEQARQNLIISKLYSQVTRNVKLTDEEIKEEYRESNEEISIDYLASLPAELEKDISVTEEDAKEYFTNDSVKFKRPPAFNLEYIILDSEDKLKDFTQRLNKNRDFTQTAKDMGLTVNETGLFTQTDPVPGIGWSPEIQNMISKLKIGEHSQPLQSDKNYYVLRLKEKKEVYIPEFEDIKDEVKNIFTKEKSQRLAKEKIEQCLKDLKELYQEKPKSINFKKLAKKYNLKSDSSDTFKFNSYIEGIGASDKFWLAAQNLKEDEFSEIISVSSGFYIIKLKSKVPIDEEKFKEEKEEFSENLLSQKRLEFFTKFIEDLKRKVQKNF